MAHNLALRRCPKRLENWVSRNVRRVTQTIGRRRYLQSTIGVLTIALTSIGQVSATQRSNPDGEASSAGVLTIEGTQEISTFEFTIDGIIVALDDNSVTQTHISGGNAEGVIENEVQQYEYVGELTDIRIRGTATAYVD